MNNEIKDIIAELKGLIAIKEIDDEIEAFVKSASTWECPEGYIFKDENGNIINAKKIVLEKKQREYPKSYEECIGKLPINWDGKVEGYKCDLLTTFQKLLICRDAYWKLYGEEIGLGKPWKPDSDEDCFFISRSRNSVLLSHSKGNSEIFEFPTKEMRDSFKKNFDPDIEFCKELL